MLLALILVYTTFQLHLPSEFGVPGMNMINLLVAFAFAGLLVMGSGGTQFDRPWLKGPLLAYFAAMTLAFLIAVVMRPGSVIDDVTYLKTTLFYPLYYVLFYYGVRDRRTALQLVVVIMVVAVIAAAEAWMEGIAFGIGSYVETNRASGPFGVDHSSANRAGVFYAMFVPVFAGLAVLLKEHKVWRALAVVATVLSIGAVIFTFSRQAYAITLVALALVAWRRGGGAVSAVLLAGLLLLPFLPDSATERIQSTQVADAQGVEGYDESTASRFEIWSGAFRMWADHPMGVGHNRFKEEIGKYSQYPGMDAHNYFILTLAEAGVLGLAALLWLVVALWRLARWMHYWARGRLSQTLFWTFSVMVICMVLGNLFGSPFREGAVMGGLWALAGILERLTQLEYERAEEPEPAGGLTAEPPGSPA